MINVVITAGGTSEPIDKVRKITNSSTGRLGSIIANTLLENPNIYVTYICTRKSIKPLVKYTNMEILEIEKVNELKSTVERVLKEKEINYFIHSMAVSDYYVDYVTTASLLEEYIDKENIKDSILNPSKKLDNSSKLSSSEDNLVVILRQSPKVISVIKNLSPNTKLIGFKLLENVSEEELIKVAINLKDKNNCDYVIANDLKNITKDTHKAYLIDKNNQIKIANTKQEIAQKIKELI